MLESSATVRKGVLNPRTTLTTAAKESLVCFSISYEQFQVSTLTSCPDAEIHDVGDTGLTADQEFWNRERKYSLGGVDVRKFSMSKKGGFEPQDDPYYGRKKVSS